jgi:hypothetical protein
MMNDRERINPNEKEIKAQVKQLESKLRRWYSRTSSEEVGNVVDFPGKVGAVIDAFSRDREYSLKAGSTRYEIAREAIAKGCAAERLGLNVPLVRNKTLSDYFAAQTEEPSQRAAAGA